MVNVSPATAEAVLAVFGDTMTADHVGCRFTCTEANIIADLLRELTREGSPEALTWLWGHADGDDDSGDSHQMAKCTACDQPIRGDGFRDEDADTLAAALYWVTEDGGVICPQAPLDIVDRSHTSDIDTRQ